MSFDVQDFQKDVIEASHELPVLVDFWADWCAPCRVLGPVLERLALESGDRWKLAKVDTEAFREESARYQIGSIPSVKLFVDGVPVNEFVGALPEGQVRAWLDRAIPSDADRAARAALDEAREVVLDDPGRALTLLGAVELPPDASESGADLELLARLLLRAEEPGDLPASEAGRRYLEAIGRLREGDFDGALAGFIEAVRVDRSVDDDGPRRAAVTLFRFLGADHPAVRRRRSELTGVLYA